MYLTACTNIYSNNYINAPHYVCRQLIVYRCQPYSRMCHVRQRGSLRDRYLNWEPSTCTYSRLPKNPYGEQFLWRGARRRRRDFRVLSRYEESRTYIYTCISESECERLRAHARACACRRRRGREREKEQGPSNVGLRRFRVQILSAYSSGALRSPLGRAQPIVPDFKAHSRYE